MFDVAAFDEFLKSRIDRADLDPRLADAIRYAVLGPGKRVRPKLCVLAAEAVRPGAGDSEAARAAAAGIELIHAFSLVHDDLPELDNDDLRRGRPTLHRHTSHAMALLAGDAAHTLAFRILDGLDAGTAHVIRRELAGATLAMIDGQVRDTFGPGDADPTDPAEAVMEIHRRKTGALILGAVRCGAHAAKAPADQLRALSLFAEAIGLMFQAVDDLLDVTSTAEHTGKATGKDAAAGKTTFPGLFGIDGTRSRIAAYRADAHAALAGLGASADPLRAIADTLAARDR